MPTALVTGVAGFVGSNLAIELLDRGYTVRGIDDLSTGRMGNLDPFTCRDRFQFHEGDIRHTDTVEQLADGADVLFHQAAAVSVPGSIENPPTTTEVNCVGAATVLEAARRSTVETAVLASSGAFMARQPTLRLTRRRHRIPNLRMRPRSCILNISPTNIATFTSFRRSRCDTSTSSARDRTPTANTPP